jgi:hypothetical protein
MARWDSKAFAVIRETVRQKEGMVANG